MRLMEWAELADKGRECWKRLKECGYRGLKNE